MVACIAIGACARFALLALTSLPCPSLPCPAPSFMAKVCSCPSLHCPVHHAKMCHTPSLPFVQHPDHTLARQMGVTYSSSLESAFNLPACLQAILKFIAACAPSACTTVHHLRTYNKRRGRARPPACMDAVAVAPAHSAGAVLHAGTPISTCSRR